MGWPLFPPLPVTDSLGRVPIPGLPTLCHNLLQRYRVRRRLHTTQPIDGGMHLSGAARVHSYVLQARLVHRLSGRVLCVHLNPHGRRTPFLREVAFKCTPIPTFPGTPITLLTDVTPEPPAPSPSPNVTSPAWERNKKK